MKQYIRSLLNNIQQSFDIDGTRINLRFYIGVSIYPEDALQYDHLIRKSREALQSHAESGDSYFHFFNIQYRQAINYLMHLEKRLLTALDKGALDVALQPIVHLPKGTIYGYEALCRWYDAELGNVPPNEFIPIIQQTGHMSELTLFMCDQIGQYANNKNLQFSPIISINVTYQTLRDTKFVSQFKRLLQHYALPYHSIQLELTENDLISHFTEFSHSIKNWRQYEMKIAIDDFGTGYSALSYLTRLDVDTVKIDKSFIQSIDSSDREAELVRLIIHLNRALGYTITAEGVENSRHADLLNQYGCDLAQGFYWGYPQIITNNRLRE